MRLRQAKRDAIDNLARRIIDDHRIPCEASRSMHEAHLRSKGYSVEDIAVFLEAWIEMRNETLSNRDNRDRDNKKKASNHYGTL